MINIKLKIIVVLFILSSVLFGTVNIDVANSITKQLYDYTVEDGMYLGPWWKSVVSPEAADSVQIAALKHYTDSGYKWTSFPYLVELYIFIGSLLVIITGFILFKIINMAILKE